MVKELLVTRSSHIKKDSLMGHKQKRGRREIKIKEEKLHLALVNIYTILTIKNNMEISEEKLIEVTKVSEKEN